MNLNTADGFQVTVVDIGVIKNTLRVTGKSNANFELFFTFTTFFKVLPVTF